MIIEVLAILAIPAIASTAYLLGKQSVESRENEAYRCGLQDGYHEGIESQSKVLRMAK